MEGQQYQYGPEGGTFGRSADNTWVLPDVSRHVSSLHARISFEKGRFIIRDESTNGLFVNGSPMALGPNNPIALNQGDRLTLGDYSLQVSLAQGQDLPKATQDNPAATQIFSAPVSNASFDDLDKWLEPAAPKSQALASPSVSSAAPETSRSETLGDIDLGLKPQETDPLAALGGASAKAKSSSSGGALSDLVGDSASLDQQMMKVPKVIPNDWDDLLGDELNAKPAAKQADPLQNLLQTAPDKAGTGLPHSDQAGAEQLSSLGQGEPQIDPNVTPVDPVIKDMGLSELLSTPAEQLQQMPDASKVELPKEALNEQPAEQPPAATHQTRTDALASPQASTSAPISEVDVTNLAKELGLEHLSEAQKAVLHTAVANTVKATVSGMMKTLRARSEVKSEFRMNMTTIQSAENNPLKFSVTPEDAIENMFAKQGKAYLSPVDAITDGFADISDHQVALFDAMKAAYEYIFGQFDPEFLAQKFERTSSKRFLGGKAKNWDAFQLLYSEYKEDKEQTFKRLFGEIFADAYERRMHSLKMSRSNSSNK